MGKSDTTSPFAKEDPSYKRHVVLDCEADALYDYLKGTAPSVIHCACASDLNSGRSFDFVPDEHASGACFPISRLPEFLDSCGLIYAHNGIQYDRNLINDVLGYLIPISKIRDTLVLSHFGNNTKYFHHHPRRRQRHSVEAWADWLGLDQKKVTHTDWSVFSKEMLHRCRTDITIQLAITREILKELKNTPEYAIDLEMRFAEYINRLHKEGFYCDESLMNSFLDQYSDQVLSLETEIQKAFPPKNVLVKHFVPRFKKCGTLYDVDKKFMERHGLESATEQDVFVSVPFNIGSPQQRIERLLEVGWVPLETTKGGNPKSPKASCPSLVGDHLPPAVRLFGAYLIALSRVNTLIQWQKSRDAAGYIHCSIQPIGTWTYRSAHQNPNMGNVPSRGEGSEVRACFRVESDSRVLVGADASGIQSRAMAHYIAEATGDFTYVKVVSDPAVDIHEYNREIAGIATRAEAKTFYYQFLLGGGYFKTGKIFKIDPSEYAELLSYMHEAGIRKTLESSMSFTNTPLNDENFAIATRGYQVKTSFIEKVPGLAKFQETAIRTMGQRGYVTLLDGRHTAVESSYNVMAALLQGFETIIMRRTLVAVAWELDRKKIPWWPRNYVHDESQIETTAEHAEFVGQTFRKHLIESGVKLGSLCPLDAEYKTHVEKETLDADGNLVKTSKPTTSWKETH